MNRKEFENDLLNQNVTEKYLNMSREELEESFGSEFLKTVDFGGQNNNNHQYELFEHILRTVDSIEPDGLSQEDLLKVKIAAFFHDIGKPNVAKLNEKTGQTQYIGHAKQSAELATSILENLGYDEQEITELNFLIQSHDDFIPIAKKEDVTKERISKILTSIAKRADNYTPTISSYKKLIALCKGDAMAQNKVIERNEEVIDTQEDRIARLESIQEILPEAIILKQENEIAKLEKQKRETKNGPAPIEKKGRIVNQKQIDIWNSMTQEEKEEKLSSIDAEIAKLKQEEAKLLETSGTKLNQVEFVKKALDNAKKIIMGKDKQGNNRTYLDVMLGQRIEGSNNAGSSYVVSSPEKLYEELISQEWEETTHPDVMPGCRVFKTNLAGLEGILNLDDLPDNVELYAIDPKETGKIGIGAGEVEKTPAQETYLIVGKEKINGKDEDVVFTFHPGEPVRPSEVETKEIPDGTRLTKEAAEKLGFTKVKYLSEEMLEQYRHKQKAMQLEDSINKSHQLDSVIAELENKKEKNDRS